MGLCSKLLKINQNGTPNFDKPELPRAQQLGRSSGN
jgi:hypothetical protein